MKALVTDRFTQASLSRLKSELNCEVVQSPEREIKSHQLENVDVLLIRSRTPINEKFLGQDIGKLKLIVTATSGFDHIDLDFTNHHKVTVMHTPDAQVPAVAELTIARMIDLVRQIKKADQSIKQGGWKDSLPPGGELFTKSLGIIGLGRIGKKVAHIANALGMQVMAFDPYVEDFEYKKYSVERVGLTELIKTADIISLHLPLTKKTKHIINRHTLEHSHDGSLIINTARGGLIDENDLVEFLEIKKIAGAALDVFEKEPLRKDSRLRSFPQVLLTPHIGASTDEAFTRASQMAVDKVLAFFKHNATSDLLPPEANWYQDSF